MTINRQIVSEDFERIICGSALSRLQNQTILVTGANGFLPSYMVETILHLNDNYKTNCTVLALVRNLSKAKTRFSKYLGRSDLQFIESDVVDFKKTSIPVHYIIHAASLASPKHYGVDPVGVMKANLLGTQVLLEYARNSGIKSFLFFSSGEVYGQVVSEQVPTSEDQYGYVDILNIRSCYAESKRAAETLGICYSHQYNVPFKIVRPFHTYGPGMALDDGRVFSDFVADVVYKRDITVKGDGSAVRAFCYISDAVEAFFKVLLVGVPRKAYNVGNPAGAMSILELADLLVSITPKLGLKVRFAERLESANYLTSPINKNIPNISEIVKLNWSPRFIPLDGFSRTLKYLCVV